jgi:N6-L-threonylcarbamoyladenine synthase
MRILGIESSCDDTSVALLDCSPQGCFVIRESTASQIDIHKKYGGVVPEIAGRMHAEKIVPLIEKVLTPPLLNKERVGVRLIKPDAIAVASGPGLITGLIVGVEAGRTLSVAWKIPLISVNHIAGHIHSVEIIKTLKQKNIKTNGEKCHCEEAKGRRGNLSGIMNDNKKIQYPALALIVSGGHTEIIKMSAPNKYKLIGATRDDASGECFDKVAKLLGLPYPGGPQISKLALTGNPTAIDFPRPMLDSNNYDFSFSGLKTSALYYLRDNPLVIPAKAGIQSRKITINDFCASFEQAIVDTLVGKMSRAIKKFKPKTIILCGGVSANKKLRETMAEEIKINFPNSNFLVPEPKYCMDNAVMIAVAGWHKAQKKEFTDWRKLKANPNWELGRPH